MVLYPDPTVTYHEDAQLPLSLVIYRAGRVLHISRTEQTFRYWQFQDGGKRVPYSTAPHAAALRSASCRDVDSGRMAARWLVKGGAVGAEAPAWPLTLRF
jgi:hypothetical protein